MLKKLTLSKLKKVLEFPLKSQIPIYTLGSFNRILCVGVVISPGD